MTPELVYRFCLSEWKSERRKKNMFWHIHKKKQLLEDCTLIVCVRISKPNRKIIKIRRFPPVIEFETQMMEEDERRKRHSQCSAFAPFRPHYTCLHVPLQVEGNKNNPNRNSDLGWMLSSSKDELGSGAPMSRPELGWFQLVSVLLTGHLGKLANWSRLSKNGI